MLTSNSLIQPRTAPNDLEQPRTASNSLGRPRTASKVDSNVTQFEMEAVDIFDFLASSVADLGGQNVILIVIFNYREAGRDS